MTDNYGAWKDNYGAWTDNYGAGTDNYCACRNLRLVRSTLR